MSRITRIFDRGSRWTVVVASSIALLAGLLLAGGAWTRAQDAESEGEESRIRKGLAISPVELDLKGKNLALVGLGSYIVNAQAQCSNCHTQPQFEPGGNPFLGQPEEIPADVYLGGGRVFGAFVSRNITPDADTGLPAGLTFEEFVLVMRTGTDLDNAPPHVPSADNDLLQVMQWPVFRNMTDRDLRAIYEYLRSIPSVP
jgi:hypothetical protein